MELTILLVDDDQLLTEKTKNSLNWNELGIGMVFTANNIHEAKGILKVYKVDILLCDVDMPMGNGLELVEWIRESKMEIKCIFLSSYANFTYAQKALRLGSVNYLLKPISNKDLEAELKTVCDGLIAEHSSLNSKESMQKEEEWKELLVQTLSEEAQDSGTVCATYDKTLQIETSNRNAKSSIYPSVQPITFVLAGLLDNSEERQKVKDISLYNYCVRIAAKECLCEFDLDVVVTYKDTEWLLVLKKLVDCDQLERKLDAMQKKLYEQTGHNYCFYITMTRPYSETARMIRTISQMREHAIPNKALVIWEKQWSLRKISYPDPDWENWYEKLRQGIHKQADPQDDNDTQSSAYLEVLNEMVYYIETACNSGNWYLTDLKRFVQRISDLLYRVLRDNNDTFEELFDWMEFSGISFLARRSEQGCINLIQYIWTKMENFHHTEDKTEAVIGKLKSYIEEHLDGDLNRTVLAGQVYLSEDYVTRLFIKETGMTLPNYIAGRRMEKAARLLRESTDPISRIAMEVGYSNFSYFSKSFKDYAGCTPNEYRARHRNINKTTK